MILTNKTAERSSVQRVSAQAKQIKQLAQGRYLEDNRGLANGLSAMPLQAVASSDAIQRKTVIENIGQTCKYGQANNAKSVTVGHTMHAWLDPADPVRGQSASVNASQDDLMAWIKGIYPLAKGAMSVKGHLLNDNLGGTALDNNLYPISKGANGKHLSTSENYVKNEVWKNKNAVKYSVVVAGSTDYTSANTSNAKATFQTTVRPWKDVTDTSNVGAVDYTANITSDLGSPKDRTASDGQGTALDNISAYGLKPNKEPAKSVGDLSNDEKQHRKDQPIGLQIDSQSGYKALDATASGDGADSQVWKNAEAQLKDSPQEFVEEHMDDVARDIATTAIEAKSDVSDALAQAFEAGMLIAFWSGLPTALSQEIEKNEWALKKLEEGFNAFFIEEHEDFHKDAD
ncbi:hypothetical protein [Pseudoalteromonas sp. MMG022]|uniref:hypothetical protein n=1 Tax=Pseudoalteromonas sp. MMG022 TaxID=2909978 RepID=UPI001F3805F4|nr:hypothetical protein [Pseudoalteromonas sp. MMG022]MCF6435668.1 hypothetical protein [Pseudoalteromonas sp. MMG022]